MIEPRPSRQAHLPREQRVIARGLIVAAAVCIGVGALSPPAALAGTDRGQLKSAPVIRTTTSPEVILMAQQPTFAESEKPQETPQWVYGREGMPPSPGITFGPPPAHPPLTERQEWFKNLKFGMFIHWGLDSVLASHPGVPAEAARDINWDASSLGPELAKLGESFDAKAWVDLAERSGQRYIAFTTKHHIGFANFASKYSDYTSAAMGPKRDFVRALADECHRRGMPFIAYLSLPDLKHPDCRPLDKAAWDRYTKFLMGQIEELATNYGPIMAFWLDPGPWNGPSYHYPVAEIQEIVHRRWPGTLCFDWDESEQSYASRAYLSPEGMVMAYEIYPPAKGPQPDAWPFEVCDTLNNTWFYNPGDAGYKDVPTLIRRLVEIVGRGGNYLLNMGPPPSGAINPEDAQRFEAMGEWLRRNGEAVYDTRPLGIPAQPWGWPAVNGDRVYLHILNWPGGKLTLPGIKQQVVSARWLNGGALEFETSSDSVTLYLPDAAPDAVDSIAVLEMGAGRLRESPRRAGVTNVPGLVKTGTVYADVCEGTPIVWQGRLLLLLNFRPGEAEGKPAATHYLELRDAADNSLLSRFADGYSLASAFAWDGVLHVYGARYENGGWNDVTEFKTRDLMHWTKPRVVVKQNPDEQLFNQSVCRAGDRFVMAYESNDPRWPAFTIKFAESPDLVTWTTTAGCVFGTDRYTACPWLTRVDGYFYMLYLEHIRPQWRFETYLTRSKDLVNWESSPRNPILAPGPGEDANTSDPDMTQFGGNVLLYYSFGDQRTWSKLTRAEFAGTLREFLAACYPQR
jgi:alpha-L-fucosidase